MSAILQAAGFIVQDDIAIWGVGDTAHGAWQHMLDGMASAGIEVVTEAEMYARTENDDNRGNLTCRDQFQTLPATAALIAMVESRGGNIAWGEVDGVACTSDEQDEALASEEA